MDIWGNSLECRENMAHSRFTSDKCYEWCGLDKLANTMKMKNVNFYLGN